MMNIRRLSMLPMLALIAGSMVSLYPSEALAWSKAGHLTVCDYAYRTVSDDVRADINALLKADGEYSSFNYGCVEEDDFPRKNPDDHFINYARNQRSIVNADCPQNDSCILQGIERDLAILSDRSKPAKARAKALLGLGHWVGDIHQPLHISFADDRGGNYLLVKGLCGSGQKSNLHSVWDKCLVEKFVLGTNLSRDWAGFTVTYRAVDRLVPLTSSAEKMQWTSSQPWQWAQESYAITLKENTLYCTMNLSNTQCSKPTEPRISINQDYISSNGPVVEKRLRQAGVRLAYLIEKALAR